MKDGLIATGLAEADIPVSHAGSDLQIRELVAQWQILVPFNGTRGTACKQAVVIEKISREVHEIAGTPIVSRQMSRLERRVNAFSDA